MSVDLTALTDPEEPTQPQVDLLLKLGLGVPETKEEASRMITEELEYRREKRFDWLEDEDAG